MFCTQCGQSLPGQARFCPGCGTPNQPQPVAAHTVAEPAAPPREGNVAVHS